MGTNLIFTGTYTGKVAQEVYSNLLLGADTLSKQSIQIVESATGLWRLPTLEVTPGSPAYVCAPTIFSDITIGVKDITLDRRQINIKQCKDDYIKLFDQSGIWNKSGSGVTNGPSTTLMQKIINRIIDKNYLNIENFIWQASSVAVDLNLLVSSAAKNGFLAQFTADATVIDVLAAGPIDATTILVKLNSMLAAASPELIRRIWSVGDVTFWLPAEYQLFVMQAFNTQNVFGISTVNGLMMESNGVFTYQGVPLIFSTGLPPGTKVGQTYGNGGDERMVLSYKENMFFATDALSNVADIKMVDYSDTTTEDTFGIKGSFYAGMGYTFGNQIVNYSI